MAIRKAMDSWGARQTFVFSLIACAAIVGAVVAVYCWWFGVHHYASLSRSPQAWANFANFFALTSLPFLLSIGIAAFIANQREQRRLEQTALWVTKLSAVLERLCERALDAQAPVLLDQLETAALEVNRSCLLVLNESARPLPPWARIHLEMEFRLVLRAIRKLGSFPAIDLSHQGATDNWTALFDKLDQTDPTN